MALKKNKRRIIKKKVAKKPAKKPAGLKKVGRKKIRVAKKQTTKAPLKKEQNVIGAVTHYFPKVRAAVVKLKAPLAIGDIIKIKGHTTDFKQVINSLQIDRLPIDAAKKGQEIGILVDSRVRQHDTVYKVESLR